LRFAAEQLGAAHDLSHFDSAQPELDSWLVDSAQIAQVRRTARTFVWHRGDGAVLAYYSLTAHLLQRDEVTHALGRGAPRQIPAVLLARLAPDRSLHAQGLGGALLAEALERVLAATETVAARFVVVDAIDEQAAGFYEHHGFRRIPETQRLLLPARRGRARRKPCDAPADKKHGNRNGGCPL
jgi:predicted N-acetyltransferase YhbS